MCADSPQRLDDGNCPTDVRNAAEVVPERVFGASCARAVAVSG